MTVSPSPARRRTATVALAVALSVVVLLALALAWAFGPGARSVTTHVLASRTGGRARLDGPLSLTPGLSGFTLRFAGLHIAQAPAFGPGDLASVAQGEVALPWSALLGDDHVLRLSLKGVSADLKRDIQGRGNWSSGRGGAAPKLPHIDRLEIEDGRLALQDAQRGADFTGVFATAPAKSGGSDLTLSGKGQSEAGPWSLSLVTPAALAVDGGRPLEAEVQVKTVAGPSQARFEGRLGPGAALSGRVAGTGVSLHDIGVVTHLPLPRTPPYRLSAQVGRKGSTVVLSGVSGTVGQSDVAGEIDVTPVDGARRLDGRLRSKSLRMADLLAVASGGQLGAKAAGDGRLLPNGAIRAEPLRKLEGALTLDAAYVQSRAIRSLALRVTFDRGRVAFDPLDLQLAAGRARIRLALDARGSRPVVALDATLTEATIQEFITRAQAPVQAVFDASVRLKGAGASLAQAAAGSSGEIGLRVRSGRMQKLGAAVVSHDLFDGISALADGGKPSAAIRCGVARFPVSDGIGRARQLTVVTDAGAAVGYGQIDLRSETLDLQLRPAEVHGPDVTTVGVTGPIVHPHVQLELNQPKRIFGGLFKLFQPGPRTSGPSAPACG